LEHHSSQSHRARIGKVAPHSRCTGWGSRSPAHLQMSLPTVANADRSELVTGRSIDSSARILPLRSGPDGVYSPEYLAGCRPLLWQDESRAYVPRAEAAQKRTFFCRTGITR